MVDEQKLANLNRQLANMKAAAEEREASKRVTAEHLGKVNTGGPTECHKKVYKDRRIAIIHRFAVLGDGLPAEQRNNLVLFMEQ